MAIFLVLVGLAELAIGFLVFIGAPSITQQIFAAVILCAAFVSFGLAELVNIGNKVLKAVETRSKAA